MTTQEILEVEMNQESRIKNRLLRIKRSRLVLAPYKENPRLVELYQGHPFGWRHWAKPRIHWRDDISRSALEHLGIPKEELESLAGDEVRAELLVFLSHSG